MKKTSLLVGLCLVLAAPLALAQGTAFTYQGRLNNGTNPANGTYDLTFALFSVSGGAGQVGPNVTNSAVAISNGLFTVALDFGANFPGANRWLEIGVRTNGAGAFTTLTPRQKLTAAPYAITASNLSGPLSSASLSGTYTGAITLNNAGNSFSGSGAGLTGVNAITLGGFGADSFWRLLGNGGTTAGLNFLGTTDDQPLEFKVNNTRAFRLEPNATSPNVIGGYSGNAVIGGAVGATIAGGGSSGAENIISDVSGSFGTIGGGAGNYVWDWIYGFGTIAGGQSNQALSRYSSISGGKANRTYGSYDSIGGGVGNITTEWDGSGGGYGSIGGGAGNGIHGLYATIGGGESNNIYNGIGVTIAGGSGNASGASGSTIGGGGGNLIDGYYLGNPPSAYNAVIAGGSGNVISFGGSGATISGGSKNNIETADWDLPPWGAVVGGGRSNLVSASHGTVSGGEINAAINAYSTVGGGRENVAGGFSATVAGGTNNNAISDGSSIGGGSGNSIPSQGAPHGTIAGGEQNTLGCGGGPGCSGHFSVVGGGFSNTLYDTYSVIAGGAENIVFGNMGQGGVVIGGGVGNRITRGFTDGSCSTLSGGLGNSIESGTRGTISGGESNSMGGHRWGTISGGAYNRSGALGGTIGGGANNLIQGVVDLGVNYPNYCSTISGGSQNTIEESSFDPGFGASTIAGGSTNHIARNLGGTSIGGGMGNVAGRSFSTIPGGLQAMTTSYGQMAYASGQFANTGDAQTSTYVTRGTTTTANLTELFLDGTGQRMVIPVNSTWVFEVFVAGRSSTGNSAGYQIRGTIKNNGGTTSFVGLTSFSALGSDVPAWDASVAADNANDALRVQVNGSAGNTVRWVATVRTTEVSF